MRCVRGPRPYPNKRSGNPPNQNQDGGYTLRHHSGSTTYGASSNGEVYALADALGLPQSRDTPIWVWVVVGTIVETPW